MVEQVWNLQSKFYLANMGTDPEVSDPLYYSESVKEDWGLFDLLTWHLVSLVANNFVEM